MAIRTLHLDLEMRTGPDRVARPVVDGMLRLKASSGPLVDARTAAGLVGGPALGPALSHAWPDEQWGLEEGEPPAGRRLLGVFAHPDDETFCAGGTFARYAGQGAEIMVVSATRGQAGQIRDAAAATRRTIGAVREAELRLACSRLGIKHVRCLDHADGNLAGADFSAMVDEIAEVIEEFRPDGIITFGPDGGYGHPDHMTISAVTTAACMRVASARVEPDRAGAARPGHRRPRLYYRSFPAADILLMERLAEWLVGQPNRFAGTSAFAHALLVLAEEAVTLRHIRDHVQVRWYPAGAYVVEQGEAATELYLVLSGAAQVWKEADGGQREQLARLGVGEFFGELGVAGQRRRNADVLAAESLTCLVLSATPPSKFAGRGREVRLARAVPDLADDAPMGDATGQSRRMVACDVSEQLKCKVDALCAYRTQLALEPEMFPEFLLREIFAWEYFEVADTASTVRSGPHTAAASTPTSADGNAERPSTHPHARHGDRRRPARFDEEEAP